MIIYNPQDLTPLLTAMREGLQADMNALTANVQTANNALSQSVSTEIDALTVVNGEIKTDVQAINANTNTKLETTKTELIAATEKRAVFAPLSSQDIRYVFDANDYTEHVVLDVTGGGYLKTYNFAASELVSIEIDGREYLGASAVALLDRLKATFGAIEFSTSMKITAKRSTQYSASADLEMILGVFEWK